MIDSPTYLGILSTKTIAYAGLALLTIFLLIIIGWGIVNLISGGDLISLAVTAVSGAILIIVAYIVIFNVANIGVSEDTPPEIVYNNMRLMSQSPAYIDNIQLCYNNSMPCNKVFPTNDIYIYWEIPNGIGCCNTFGCNREVYESFCGTPYTLPFRLYSIFFDGVEFDWSNIGSYDYVCSTNTPWQYFSYNNISMGVHNITIIQRDCVIDIDTKTITFNISQDVDGYIVRVI
jgi:hypothetical protein